MLRVTPYQISQTPYNKRQRYKAQTKVAFCSNQLDEKVPMPTVFSLFKLQKSSMPWVKDENLLKAVNQLNYIKFDKDDVKHVQSMGAILPFKSGKEAVEYIKGAHIGIKYDKLSSENIHAQYDSDSDCIKINEIYKNTQNPAEILAISEAILHEAGHAKDGDGGSSLQEEIDCLAMNAVAHRAIVKNSPNAFSTSNSLIVKDGVCIYGDLFFGADDNKSALVERIKMKYRHLPVGDFKHPPSALAYKVKN